MYPEELELFIKSRNHYIGGDDLIKVISRTENPQLIQVLYDNMSKKYTMKDIYNNEYEFTAMPYEEAKAKGLVKTKIKQNKK